MVSSRSTRPVVRLIVAGAAPHTQSAKTVPNVKSNIHQIERLGIGLAGSLPWHIPEDLKFFQQLTTGRTVIMGHKTWDSIPPKFRPLPNRRNVILTRGDRAQLQEQVPDGVIVASDLASAISDSQGLGSGESGDSEIRANERSYQDVVIIGGNQLYQEAKKLREAYLLLYLTRILPTKTEIRCDTFLEGNWVVDKIEQEFADDQVKAELEANQGLFDWRLVTDKKSGQECWICMEAYHVRATD